MQQRATKLIFAGMSTLAVGIGIAGTVSAIGSPDTDMNSLKASSANNAQLQGTIKAPSGTAQQKASADVTQKKATKKALLSGSTKGSYFWDTGHSGAGDTGAPASGLPMQKGCFASPSWPMGTKGYITYNGKKASFFICDRGPGNPSSDGVMLDIDGKTYAQLTGGKWNEPYVSGGNGQAGHIKVKYYVTKWGSGAGDKGKPHAYSG